MRDWKKAFGQPDDGFTLRVQQTLLAIEEKEEEPMKKKMTLSLAFACILFVTVLALSAYAASNILGGRPDETLSPGENSLPDPTAAPTPIPLDWEEGMVWSAPQGRYYHVEETCGGMTNAQFVTLEEARARGQEACPNCMGPIMSTPAPTLEPDLLPMVTSEPTPIPMAPEEISTISCPAFFRSERVLQRHSTRRMLSRPVLWVSVEVPIFTAMRIGFSS